MAQRGRKPRVEPAAALAAWEALKAQGRRPSVVAVAQALGVGRTAARRALVAAGIPIPRKGRQGTGRRRRRDDDVMPPVPVQAHRRRKMTAQAMARWCVSTYQARAKGWRYAGDAARPRDCPAWVPA